MPQLPTIHSHSTGHIRRLLLAFMLAVTATGCTMVRTDQAAFNNQLKTGNYDQAFFIAESKYNYKDVNVLLWSLQAGLASRRRDDYQTSNKYLQEAEDLIKESAQKSTVNSGIWALSSLIVNDSTAPYQACEYDGIMINTYKALNYISLKEFDDARVEFNRALDRQRRAKEHFAKLIAKQREAVEEQHRKEKDKNPDKRVNLDKTIDNPTVTDVVKNRYSNFASFGVYPDFINPYTTYLSALFFTLSGDKQKASPIMAEAAGMLTDNPVVQEDFHNLEQALDTGKPVPPAVWVIFENGSGPYKEEFIIDLPLFLANGRTIFTTMALPSLRQGEDAFDHLEISAAGKTSSTTMLASMDKVVQTEFKDLYPAIVTRSLLSAALKSTIQYKADKELGPAGMLASRILQITTTSADLRIWSALPKNFQLARMPMPADGKITVTPPGQFPVEISIPQCNYAIVYVTIQSSSSKPLVNIIPFQPLPIQE